MRWLPICALALATPAAAQSPPRTYVLTAPLVEELFQRLQTTGLVTMLQGEIQHQPQPVTCPEQKPAVDPPVEKK